MDLTAIVAEIDAEISRLRQVRQLLAGIPMAVRKRSRATGVAPSGRKRKKMSVAAREKISAAQKKRWAKARKTAKKA